MNPCPLIFEPIFKPKIWGGRRLESLLGKPLPAERKIGESWELADLEDDQSVVAAGPARGKSLGQLVKDWGAGLLGAARPFEGRFPLLIKFLDAHENLSIQVHPDRATAERAGGRIRYKNEAWYVIHAEPDGAIYRGLREGVTLDDLRAALAGGTIENVLQRIPVRAGESYYLPSGTIHAISAGLVLAEVQTPSDATYRLYDWDRIDEATGRPRELHVEEALSCIDPQPRIEAAEERSHVASVWTTVTRLVTCESFIVERVRMVEGLDQAIPYAQMVVWVVLSGRGAITFGRDRRRMEFKGGDTVVLPAALEEGHLTTQADCIWLEVTVPPG